MPTATAITRPACGAQAVERNVTSAGPVTKTTSSATLSAAKAVCRSLCAERMYTQRPRTMAPICGIEAPARTPHTCGQTSAHSWVIETIIRLLDSAKTTESAYSTRRCPNRSASRPCGMAKSALPTM